MTKKSPVPLDLFIDMALTISMFSDMFNTYDERLKDYGLDWAYLHKLNRRGKHVVAKLQKPMVKKLTKK